MTAVATPLPALDARDFEGFVADHQVGLRRSALALTGNGADADDLLQSTLVKGYLAWGRLDDRDNLGAYARTSSSGTVRDVGLAEISYFAAPSGNIQCYLSRSAAGCEVEQRDSGGTSEPCAEGGMLNNSVSLDASDRGQQGCSHDWPGAPYLATRAGATQAPRIGVDWWDAQFGGTVDVFLNPETAIYAVLPYGKTLVAGDSRCTMTTDGPSCTNTATGHHFTVNRLGPKLG